MPQIRVDKSKLKGFEALPPGTYTLRLDGFEPEFSKKKDSVNLNPKLTIINNANPELNDGKHRAFDNLNSQAGWVHIDFCHAFGERMTGEEDGVPMENWSSPDVGIPGDFQENEAFKGDPTKWTYVGPLLGKTATVEIIQVPGYKNPAKPQSVINKYFCQVPGCTHSHSESLA
jgi:hypothetical protein